MLLGVFAWKGVWDVFEFLINDYLNSYECIKFYSILMSASIGYSIFLFCIFIEKIIKLNRKSIDLNESLISIYFILCFFGLVAIWRAFFALFDYFVLPSQFKIEISIATHLVIFPIMYLLGLVSALNGPAGFDSDDNKDQNSTDKTLFSIKYF